MRIVSKNPVKTTHLALLTCLFFTLFSCSQLETSSKSSITFTLSAPRAALGISSNDIVMVDVELQGEYSAAQTSQATSNENLVFTFNDVPVGKSVKVFAQVYTPYENEKAILYEGVSDVKRIQKDENHFDLKLDTAYDSYVQSSSKYLILRPRFIAEHNNQKLKTNKIEFNSQKEDESFSWKHDGLDSYQKAIITFKGGVLPANLENKIRFRLVKTSTAARYPLEIKSVLADSQKYEFLIPQYIGLNDIAVENNWDIENNSWAPDFSFYIEKIELLKDASLIDPNFNKITKGTNSCTIKNPAMQNFVSTKINKNEITFDSTQGRYDTGSGYSAAYWEYAELDKYDKITIKLKANNPNNFDQIRIVVKGFVPFNYPTVTKCHDSNGIQKVIEAADITQTLTLYRTELLDGLTSTTLTAIEFQNDSYTGEWIDNPPTDTSADANLDYKEPWQLEIEEVLLEKVGQFQINISVPSSNSDINVAVKVDGEIVTPTSDSPISVSADKEIQFVADENYTSYVWKVNGTVQTNATENIFTLDSNSLLPGNNDITLLADNNDMDLHHSWTAQISKE